MNAFVTTPLSLNLMDSNNNNSNNFNWNSNPFQQPGTGTKNNFNRLATNSSGNNDNFGNGNSHANENDALNLSTPNSFKFDLATPLGLGNIPFANAFNSFNNQITNGLNYVNMQQFMQAQNLLRQTYGDFQDINVHSNVGQGNNMQFPAQGCENIHFNQLLHESEQDDIGHFDFDHIKTNVNAELEELREIQDSPEQSESHGNAKAKVTFFDFDDSATLTQGHSSTVFSLTKANDDDFESRWKSWSHVEEVFLVGVVIDRFFKRGSLSSMRASSAANSKKRQKKATTEDDTDFESDDCWKCIKANYDRAWRRFKAITFATGQQTIESGPENATKSGKPHSKATVGVSVSSSMERSTNALSRHYKVMKSRIATADITGVKGKNFMDFRGYFDEWEEKYNINNRLLKEDQNQSLPLKQEFTSQESNQKKKKPRERKRKTSLGTHGSVNDPGQQHQTSS